MTYGAPGVTSWYNCSVAALSVTMLVVVMGVCGCGKTSVGGKLAELLGWKFAEGDAYHPAANVEKMRSG